MNAPVIAWMLSAASSLLMLGWSVPAAVHARSLARAELNQLALVRGHAASLDQQHWTPRPARQDASLAEDAARVIARAGLDASMLVGLSPGHGTLLGTSPPLKREQATLRWEGVTLPQLGRLLEHWSAAAPGWTITAVDLSPHRDGRIGPGEDVPLRVIMEASALSSAAEAPR